MFLSEWGLLEISIGTGQGIILEVSVFDFAAFGWFFICWIVYTYFADHRKGRRPNLVTAAHRHRMMWMQRMLERENRIGDIYILDNASRTASMFATTTMFILAGLVAILGALDKAQTIASELAFVVNASRALWEIKMFLLLIIFVYAFFTFVWAIRQSNFALTMVAAAPERHEKNTLHRAGFAERCARLITRGENSFNRGVRAYYFGLAVLAWFIHPWVFMAATILVVLVLHRREFRSITLKVLMETGGHSRQPEAG